MRERECEMQIAKPGDRVRIRKTAATPWAKFQTAGSYAAYEASKNGVPTAPEIGREVIGRLLFPIQVDRTLLVERDGGPLWHSSSARAISFFGGVVSVWTENSVYEIEVLGEA